MIAGVYLIWPAKTTELTKVSGAATTAPTLTDGSKVKEYDYYAVSTSNLVSGDYNYQFGYAWELSAAELNNLVIPDDQTYYLWGRNQGENYEYLHLQYAGKWDLLGNMSAWNIYSGRTWDVTSNLVDAKYYNNVVKVTPVSGYELLGIPLSVSKNTDYTLSFYLEAGTYKDFSGTWSHQPRIDITTLSPATYNPFSYDYGYPNANILSRKAITSNTKSNIEIKFNSGNNETIYLSFNACPMEDGGPVTFKFNNLRLSNTSYFQNVWKAA